MIIVFFGLSAPAKLVIYPFIYQIGRSLNTAHFFTEWENVKAYVARVVHSMKSD